LWNAAIRNVEGMKDGKEGKMGLPEDEGRTSLRNVGICLSD
jgi:hypothetical protein